MLSWKYYTFQNILLNGHKIHRSNNSNEEVYYNLRYIKKDKDRKRGISSKSFSVYLSLNLIA